MIKYFVEKFNASDDEFKITEIKFNYGDKVKSGDLLFSIESSKADIDIESDKDGYLFFNLTLGQSINVGELFYVISDDKKFDNHEIFNKNSKNGISPKGLIISQKASNLLLSHNIKPEMINKKVIKEVDVLEYIQKKESEGSSIIDENIIDLDKINMSKAIVLIGAKGGAKMCIDALSDSKEFEVIGLLDDNVKLGETVLGVPVIGNFNGVNLLLKLGIKKFVLTFGIIENRKKRHDLFKHLSSLGCEFPNIIHPKAIVEKSVVFGRGNVVLAGANIGSCVKMGDLNYLNNNSLVSHDCILDNNIHVAPGAVLASSIIIGSHVLIGMNTTIYYGIQIGESSTILNGLIINSNIPKDKIQKENN